MKQCMLKINIIDWATLPVKGYGVLFANIYEAKHSEDQKYHQTPSTRNALFKGAYC